MQQDQTDKALAASPNQDAEPVTANQTEPELDSQPQSGLSPRQLAANRANALKSTGPKTEAGLTKCTTAAATQITHGLRAQSIVITGESEPRFFAILESYLATHRPLTRPENDAVYQMVVAVWRQRRALAFQTMDFNREIARLDPTHIANAQPAVKATLAFLASTEPGRTGQTAAHHYENIYQRQYDRALRNFAALKALRSETIALDENTASLTTNGANWEEDAA